MYGIPHAILLFVYIGLAGYSIFAFSRVSKQFQLVLLFCAMIIIGDGLSLITSFMRMGNYILILFGVLAFVSTFFLLSSYHLTAKQKNIRVVLFECFLLLWFCGMYNFQNGFWPTLVVLMFSMVMIGLSLSGLMEVLNQENKAKIFRNSMFWFYGANFSFYCFSILLFALRSIEREQPANSLHNDLIIYGNIVLYVTLLYSLHLEVKKHRSL